MLQVYGSPFLDCVLLNCCYQAFQEVKQEYPGTDTSVSAYMFGGGTNLVKRRYLQNDMAMEAQIPKLHGKLQSLRFVFDRNKAVQR